MFIVLATLILLSIGISPSHEFSRGAIGYFTEHSDNEDLDYIEVENNVFFGKPDIIKVFKHTEWTLSECTYENEIIPAPDLKSYYQCDDSSGELIPQKITCRKGHIFNEKLEKCTKLPGNGYIKCIIRNSKCPRGLRGIIPHPNPKKKDLYLQCKENDIHVLKCMEYNQIFDIKKKTCVRTKLSTKLLFDESKGRVKAISCTKPEIIFKHPHLKQNCFFNCMLGHLKYELEIQCPKVKHHKHNKGEQVDDSKEDCEEDTTNKNVILERGFPNEPPSELKTPKLPDIEKIKSKYDLDKNYENPFTTGIYDNDDDETQLFHVKVSGKKPSNPKYQYHSDEDLFHIKTNMNSKEYLSHFTTQDRPSKWISEITFPSEKITATVPTVIVPDYTLPTETTNKIKTKPYGFEDDDLWPEKYPTIFYKKAKGHKTTSTDSDSIKSETLSPTTAHSKTKKHPNFFDGIFKPLKWNNKFQHTIRTIPTNVESGKIDYTHPTKPMKKRLNFFDNIFKNPKEKQWKLNFKWNGRFENGIKTIPTTKENGKIDYTHPTKSMKKHSNVFDEFFKQPRKKEKQRGNPIRWDKFQHTIKTIPTNEENGKIKIHPTKPMKKLDITKKHPNFFDDFFKHLNNKQKENPTKWNIRLDHTIKTIPTKDSGENYFSHPTKPMKKHITIIEQDKSINLSEERKPDKINEYNFPNKEIDFKNSNEKDSKHPIRWKNKFEPTLRTIPTEIHYTHPTKPMKKHHNAFDQILKHPKEKQQKLPANWNNIFDHTIRTVPTIKVNGEIYFTPPRKPMKKPHKTKKQPNFFNQIFKHRRKLKKNNHTLRTIPTIKERGTISFTHPTKPMKKHIKIIDQDISIKLSEEGEHDKIKEYNFANQEIDSKEIYPIIEDINHSNKKHLKHPIKWNNTFEHTIKTIPTQIHYTHPTKPMKKFDKIFKSPKEKQWNHPTKWNNRFEHTIRTIPTNSENGNIFYHPTKPMKKTYTTKKHIFDDIFKHLRKWNNKLDHTLRTIPTTEESGKIIFTHPTKPMKKRIKIIEDDLSTNLSDETQPDNIEDLNVATQEIDSKEIYPIIQDFKHHISNPIKWNNKYEHTIKTIPTKIHYTHPTKPMKKFDNIFKSPKEKPWNHPTKLNNRFEHTIRTVPTNSENGNIFYHPTKPMKKTYATKTHSNIFDDIFKHRRKWNNKFDHTLRTIPTTDESGEIIFTHPTKPMKNRVKIIEDDVSINLSDETEPDNIKNLNVATQEINSKEIYPIIKDFKHHKSNPIKWNNKYEHTIKTIPTIIHYTHPTKPMKKFDNIFKSPKEKPWNHPTKLNNRFEHTIRTVPTNSENGNIFYHPTKPMKKTYTTKKHPNFFYEILNHPRKWDNKFDHTLRTIPTTDKSGEIIFTHPTKPMKKRIKIIEDINQSDETQPDQIEDLDVATHEIDSKEIYPINQDFNRFEHTIRTIPTNSENGNIFYHPTKPMKKTYITKKHSNVFDDIFKHPSKWNNRFDHTLKTIPTIIKNSEIYFTHPTKPIKKHIKIKEDKIKEYNFPDQDDSKENYPIVQGFKHINKKHAFALKNRYKQTIKTIPTNNENGDIFTHPTKPMKKWYTTKTHPFNETFKNTNKKKAKHPKIWSRVGHTIRTIPTKKENGEIYYTHPTKPMKKKKVKVKCTKQSSGNVSTNLSIERQPNEIKGYNFPNQDEDSKENYPKKKNPYESWKVIHDHTIVPIKNLKTSTEASGEDFVTDYPYEEPKLIKQYKKPEYINDSDDEETPNNYHNEHPGLNLFIHHNNQFKQPQNIPESPHKSIKLPKLFDHLPKVPIHTEWEPLKPTKKNNLVEHIKLPVLPWNTKKQHSEEEVTYPAHPFTWKTAKPTINDSDDEETPNYYHNEHPGVNLFIHHNNQFKRPQDITESPHKPTKLPKLFDHLPKIHTKWELLKPTKKKNLVEHIKLPVPPWNTKEQHSEEDVTYPAHPITWNTAKPIINDSDDEETPNNYYNEHPGINLFIHHNNQFKRPQDITESPHKTTKLPKLFNHLPKGPIHTEWETFKPTKKNLGEDLKLPWNHKNIAKEDPMKWNNPFEHTVKTIPTDKEDEYIYYTHPTKPMKKEFNVKKYLSINLSEENTRQPYKTKDEDEDSKENYPKKKTIKNLKTSTETSGEDLVTDYPYTEAIQEDNPISHTYHYNKPEDINNNDDEETPKDYSNEHPGLNTFIHHTNHFDRPQDIIKSPKKSTKFPNMFEHQPKVPIQIQWETTTKKNRPIKHLKLPVLPQTWKEYEHAPLSSEDDNYSSEPNDKPVDWFHKVLSSKDHKIPEVNASSDSENDKYSSAPNDEPGDWFHKISNNKDHKIPEVNASSDSENDKYSSAPNDEPGDWFHKISNNKGHKIPGINAPPDSKDDQYPSTSNDAHVNLFRKIPNIKDHKLSRLNEATDSEDDQYPSGTEDEPWTSKYYPHSSDKHEIIPHSPWKFGKKNLEEHLEPSNKHSREDRDQEHFKLPWKINKNHYYEDSSGEEVTISTLPWKTRQHPQYIHDFPKYPPKHRITATPKTKGYGFESGAEDEIDIDIDKVIKPYQKKFPTTEKNYQSSMVTDSSNEYHHFKTHPTKFGKKEIPSKSLKYGFEFEEDNSHTMSDEDNDEEINIKIDKIARYATSKNPHSPITTTEENSDTISDDGIYDDIKSIKIKDHYRKRRPTKKKMCTTKKPSKVRDFDLSENSDETPKHHHHHDYSKTKLYKKNKYDGMCIEGGIFRFKNSCTKYYKCIKGKRHFTMSKIYKCPSCMKFNAALGKCDLPENVPECVPNNYDKNRCCTGHGLFPIPKDPHKFYKCKTNKEGEIKLKVLTCTHKRQFNPHTRKCEREYHSKGYAPHCHDNEFIVDKYNCARAYICKNKKVHSRVKCPSGYLFNTFLTHNKKIHCAKTTETKLYHWGESV